MRLRDLIETLEALPADAPLRFEDGSEPNGLCSWRGVYAELTIDSAPSGSTNTVGKLLEDAKAAVGKSFTGYKGGEYGMHEGTAVWADPYGTYYGRYPAGVALKDGLAVVVVSEVPGEYR